MTREEIKGILEAILFVWGDPIEIETLAKATQLPIADMKAHMEELIQDLEQANRGIRIHRYENSYQLRTIAEADPFIRNLLLEREEKSLSSSALETLSIIAYKQPVTRIEIDSIRGVQSSSAINTLSARGLIEEAGRLDRIGKPILYRTTQEFLRVFDLEDLSQLPQQPEEAPVQEEENGRDTTE